MEKEFSTTAQWTAPTAQRSHLGCLSGLCVRHRDRSHQPQPHLLAQSRPDLHTITGGGEEGTEEKEGRTNREYPVADEIWSGSIPCVRRNCPWPKEWNKWRERDRELVRARVCEWVCVGVLYGCTLTQAHTKSDTSQSIVQPEVATFRHRGQLKSASIQSSLMHLH